MRKSVSLRLSFSIDSPHGLLQDPTTESARNFHLGSAGCSFTQCFQETIGIMDIGIMDSLFFRLRFMEILQRWQGMISPETARLAQIHPKSRRKVEFQKICHTVRCQSVVRSDLWKIRPNIIRGGLISENPSGQVEHVIETSSTGKLPFPNRLIAVQSCPRSDRNSLS